MGLMNITMTITLAMQMLLLFALNCDDDAGRKIKATITNVQQITKSISAVLVSSCQHLRYHHSVDFHPGEGQHPPHRVFVICSAEQRRSVDKLSFKNTMTTSRNCIDLLFHSGQHQCESKSVA